MGIDRAYTIGAWALCAADGDHLSLVVLANRRRADGFACVRCAPGVGWLGGLDPVEGRETENEHFAHLDCIVGCILACGAAVYETEVVSWGLLNRTPDIHFI